MPSLIKHQNIARGGTRNVENEKFLKFPPPHASHARRFGDSFSPSRRFLLLFSKLFAFLIPSPRAFHRFTWQMSFKNFNNAGARQSEKGNNVDDVLRFLFSFLRHTTTENIKRLIIIIPNNWFPYSFVIPPTWWDFFTMQRHKYDNSRAFGLRVELSRVESTSSASEVKGGKVCDDLAGEDRELWDRFEWRTWGLLQGMRLLGRKLWFAVFRQVLNDFGWSNHSMIHIFCHGWWFIGESSLEHPLC